MIKLNAVFIFIWIWLIVFPALSHPDVFFKDSPEHGNAYLTHQFNGDRINMIMTNNGFHIALPANFYSWDRLKSYIRNEYVFADPRFRADFLLMLDTCIKSEFNGVPFLTELNRLLQHFARDYPHHVF